LEVPAVGPLVVVVSAGLEVFGLESGVESDGGWAVVEVELEDDDVELLVCSDFLSPDASWAAAGPGRAASTATATAAATAAAAKRSGCRSGRRRETGRRRALCSPLAPDSEARY
ncbi:MAG: hypothetical protein OER95_17105, partial [Acidimicrobiia bacterium]|nr:hypothetical protein [Acidimicrobiia bacterium]